VGAQETHRCWVDSPVNQRHFPQPRAARRAVAEPDWLNLGQAASYLGVAQSTIRKLVGVGRLCRLLQPRRPPAATRGDLYAFRAPASPHAPDGGPSILIVAIDAASRVRAREPRDGGYIVREAASSEEGLSRCESRAARPGSLLDVMMPQVRLL